MILRDARMKVPQEPITREIISKVAVLSGRAACGRAELRALTFLEARGNGAFSAKMQTAGTLRGNLRGNLWVPCTFRRGLIWKIRQKSGKIWAKSSKICQN